MKKKIVSVLLTAVMAMSLAACGSGTDAGAGASADDAKVYKLVLSNL